MSSPSSALATVEAREQHPLVVGIQQRMAAPAFAKMLPAGMDLDRFAAISIQAIVKNPDILTCTPESVVQAIIEAAQDGLEPTGARGGAHLVKFGNEAVLIRDYRGVIRIIVESGAAKRVEAHEVRHGDEFAIDYSSPQPLTHRPKLPPAGEVFGYYALFWLPDGSQQVEFMTVDDIEKVRAKSRGKDSFMWTEFFGQGARKTVIKRGANYLNLRPEIRERLMREDQAEFEGQIISVQRDEHLAESRRRIHDRAARLSTSEQPASPAPGCRHSDQKKLRATDAGVVCDDCGELVAGRDQGQVAAAVAPERPAPEAPAPTSPPPGGGSPAPSTMPDAQSRVGGLAVQHRLVAQIESDEDWAAFDDVLRMHQVEPPPLEATPEAIAEWNALGDRIARGDFDAPATDAEGICPEHGTPWKWVPPGITKRGAKAGQPYNGFFGCETRGCRHRPTDEWRRAHKPADG